MCGIIWLRTKTKKPCIKKLRKMYHNQQHRGQNGYGFVEVIDNTVGELQRTQTEKEVMHLLYPSQAKEVLFHHRIPTSTPNVPESNHPIPVSHKDLKYDYIVVHNGMIRNTAQLETKFLAEGYKLTTGVTEVLYCGKKYYPSEKAHTKYNDSEYFAIDIARAIENEDTKKIESDGSIAFIALQVEKDTRKAVNLYFGRNTNPLNLQVTDHLMSLSSEGEGKEVVPHKLHCLNYKTGDITTVRDLDIGYNYKPPATPSCYMPRMHRCERTTSIIWRNGKRKMWDKENMEYVNADPDDEQEDIQLRLAGFHVPIKTLQAPIDKDDPALDEHLGIVSQRTLIPGYEDTGLYIKLVGERRVFLFLDELEFEYVNLIEAIEYWKDLKKINTKSVQRTAECNLMLSSLLADMQEYDKTIKEVAPHLFQELKEGSIAITGAIPAPIV